MTRWQKLIARSERADREAVSHEQKAVALRDKAHELRLAADARCRG